MKTSPEKITFWSLLVLAGGCIWAPVFACAAVDCDRVNFAPARDFASGGDPLAVVVADFNGDRKQDFVVANGVDITLHLGDGLGGFAPAQHFAAGSFPQSPAVGDFNGDGKLDLAVPNFPQHMISVLLNNGSGGFGAPTSFAVGNTPRSAAVGDFNDDGKLDLAVVNGSSNNVSILLGNGAGSFGPPINFGVGTGPTNVVVGDFDYDGNLDLAVATFDSQELDILLGDGHGHFTLAHSYPLAGNGGAIAAADFNGDGDPDLAVCVFNIFPNNQIAIFLGKGSGRFVPKTDVIVPDAQGLTVADFNGDGKLDVATATFSGETVAVALGTGLADFAGAKEYRRLGPGKQFPIDLAAADFNRDGKPDLVTANFESADVSVLLNLPGVTIRASDPSASEAGGDPGVFRVIRTDCTQEPLLVEYNVSGTAEPGKDYEVLNGQVIIPAGKETANIRIVPLQDGRKEPTETVIITLSAAATYTLGAQSSATVTISDND